MVIKSQRVHIYHLDSAKGDTFSLRKVRAAKFSEISKFKFSGLMKRYKEFRPYQCQVFKKEMFFLCPYEEMYSHLTAHRNFLTLCRIMSHPNINFLINKQNKAPEIDPKMLKY